MEARHRTAEGFGELLQYWRRVRSLSQLSLAHEAGVSPRHVCFIETGRAKPSREMVLTLATASAARRISMTEQPAAAAPP